jgi:hypothetical protein
MRQRFADPWFRTLSCGFPRILTEVHPTGLLIVPPSEHVLSRPKFESLRWDELNLSYRSEYSRSLVFTWGLNTCAIRLRFEAVDPRQCSRSVFSIAA